MQPTIQPEARSMSLNEVVPLARQLAARDRLKLIRILAEDLETIGDIFPFQAGMTYDLPTPYGSVGAAAMLAEAMTAYDENSE